MSIPTTQKKSPWPWIFGIGCGLPVLAFVGCASLGAIMMAANPDLEKQVEQQNKEQDAKSTANTGPGKNVSTLRPTPDIAIKVTASELYKAYQDNEIAADEKFKDKIVIVSGIVDSIGKDILDTQYVVLEGDGVLFGVQCMVGDEYKSFLAKLQKGMKLSFRGTVVGREIANVIVRDAVPQ